MHLLRHSITQESASVQKSIAVIILNCFFFLNAYRGKCIINSHGNMVLFLIVWRNFTTGIPEGGLLTPEIVNVLEGTIAPGIFISCSLSK